METRETLKKMLDEINIARVTIDSTRSRLAKLLGSLNLSFEGETEIEMMVIAANTMAAAKTLVSAVDAAFAKFKDVHKEGDELILAEVEAKIVWPMAGEKTSIDSSKLVEELLDAGRRADVIKIVEVSEKSLKGLKDGLILIGKYKKKEGKKSSSVTLKELTKEELKKLAETR
jgi:hypothetical protein